MDVISSARHIEQEGNIVATCNNQRVPIDQINPHKHKKETH